MLTIYRMFHCVSVMQQWVNSCWFYELKTDEFIILSGIERTRTDAYYSLLPRVLRHAMFRRFGTREPTEMKTRNEKRELIEAIIINIGMVGIEAEKCLSKHIWNVYTPSSLG